MNPNILFKCWELYSWRILFFFIRFFALLKKWFPNHKAFTLIDTILPTNVVNKQFKDLAPYLEFYKSDIFHTSRDTLDVGWTLWVSHWKPIWTPLPKTAVKVSKIINSEHCPITKLFWLRWNYFSNNCFYWNIFFRHWDD